MKMGIQREWTDFSKQYFNKKKALENSSQIILLTISFYFQYSSIISSIKWPPPAARTTSMR